MAEAAGSAGAAGAGVRTLRDCRALFGGFFAHRMDTLACVEVLRTTALFTVAAHAALFLWQWRRKQKDNPTKQPKDLDNKCEEASAPYLTLGKSMPQESVRFLESNAEDVDHTLLASEDPSLKTAASANLHPFHQLLIQPVKGSEPGILPFKKSQSSKEHAAREEEFSPTSITVPLFLCPREAVDWEVETRLSKESVHEEDVLSRSVASEASVVSSLLLSVEEAHETRAKPTWAPMMPKSAPTPPFRRANGARVPKDMFVETRR